MAEGTAINSAQRNPLNAPTAQLLERARPAVRGESTVESPSEDAKIDRSSKDFESILLSSWLAGAEKSFATVPGGDGEDDDDTSKDQFQGIAMQALGGAMTAAGGIGIARMIAKNLHAASERQAAHQVEKQSLGHQAFAVEK